VTLLIQTPDGDTTIYKDSYGKKLDCTFPFGCQVSCAEVWQRRGAGGKNIGRGSTAKKKKMMMRMIRFETE